MRRQRPRDGGGAAASRCGRRDKGRGRACGGDVDRPRRHLPRGPPAGGVRDLGGAHGLHDDDRGTVGGERSFMCAAPGFPSGARATRGGSRRCPRGSARSEPHAPCARRARGSARRPQPAGNRFATLTVQPQATAGSPAEDEPDAVAGLLLPPGFSTEGPTQALAVNGTMANLDRGMMNDRLDAIGRGELDPATGELGQGFGPGGRGGFGGQGGPGGGGRGGPGGGPGGFVSAAGAARRMRSTRSRIIRSEGPRSTARPTSCGRARTRNSVRIHASCSA